MTNHDGVIPDCRLSRGFANHEGGKDDERVGRPDKEIPMIEFLDGRLHVRPLLTKSGFDLGSHGTVGHLGVEKCQT